MAEEMYVLFACLLVLQFLAAFLRQWLLLNLENKK